MAIQKIKATLKSKALVPKVEDVVAEVEEKKMEDIVTESEDKMEIDKEEILEEEKKETKKIKVTLKNKTVNNDKPIVKAVPKKNEEKLKPKTTKTKKSAKVFKKVGQKYETPGERDPLRIFYTSLLKQKKNSEMALKWCLERGLLTPKKAEAAVLVLSMSSLKIN